MTEEWQPRETTTHQDHVIAHVVGAKVLGHFVSDEALYLLLDIGFIWSIFLDCEMGLMPHPVAVGELEVTDTLKEEIRADVGLLLAGGPHDGLRQLIPATIESQIIEVGFFERGERRRLLLLGEEADLAIETSLKTGEIKVMGPENEKSEMVPNSSELGAVAETEHEYLHQRLREELGREPEESELDEWLRQHTEGY